MKRMIAAQKPASIHFFGAGMLADHLMVPVRCQLCLGTRSQPKKNRSESHPASVSLVTWNAEKYENHPCS